MASKKQLNRLMKIEREIVKASYTRAAAMTSDGPSFYEEIDKRVNKLKAEKKALLASMTSTPGQFKVRLRALVNAKDRQEAFSFAKEACNQINNAGGVEHVRGFIVVDIVE